MSSSTLVAALIFGFTLVLTFGTAIYARARSTAKAGEEDLAGRSLNKWLIGLSAGTTGNSGFIVTGAVGLGYAGGVQWLLLPIGWLLGDLVFWSFFPDRLNGLSRKASAATLSEVLTFDLGGPSVRLISVTVSVLLTVFLATYTAAQWLAGEKFLFGAFELPKAAAIVAFGLTIVVYSSIGGFRGSVYVDVMQAFIRIAGTIIALIAVSWFALHDKAGFRHNIEQAGPAFLNPTVRGSILATASFVAGYALAAIGFGLGQPQIVSRYFAGRSPRETKSARWIYIGFLQFTWIAMTGFGVLLRGVMPGLSDPETGLSVFFQQNIGAVATGVIFADVFATIASTSNGLLVAIAQMLRRDLLNPIFGGNIDVRIGTTALTLAVGILTIGLSFILPGNVFSIAVDAISKMGASLAGAMMIKSFGWRHTGNSLLASILAGTGAGFIWSALGFSGSFNEAGIGIVASLSTNFLVAALPVGVKQG